MDARSRETARVERVAETGREASLMEVSVASVVFAFDGTSLRVLCVPRTNAPTEWLLPTHTFEYGLSLKDAAHLAVKRALKNPDDVSLSDLFYQIGTVSLPPEEANRPAVEVGFLAVAHVRDVSRSLGASATGSETQESQAPAASQSHWLDVNDMGQLDEASRQLVASGLAELRRRARFESIVFSLLPPEFSLSDLQKAFEIIIGRSIDVRNFRKKMEALSILVESPNKPRGMAHRPPRLFSFSPTLFDERKQAEGEIRFF